MMTARSAFVVAMVGAMVFAMVPAPAAGQDVVTLTVTVETDGGQTVGSADLTATWDGGEATATTAANGKAFLDVPAGADVEIAVDHPEYIRNNPYSVDDAATDDVTVTVYNRASTSFEVTDSDGPVDDASVTLFRHGRVGFAQQTTADGTIATGDIEAGEYLLVVEKSGYYDTSRTIELAPGVNPERNITLERGTVTLHLNVTDPYFDPARPIEGVTAAVSGVGSVQTQSNGQQQINVPVNTQLTVRFSKTGYQPVEQSLQTEEESMTLDAQISRTPEIEVSVLNDQVVVGQPVFLEVVDEYGDPIDGATVMLDGSEVATTSGDGRAQMTLESEGEHSIRVTKDGVDSGETIVTGVVVATSTETTTTTTTTAATTTTTSATTETTTAPVPGFGPIVAIVGIVLGTGMVRRRRR